MIIKNYDNSPESFKAAWFDLNNAKGIEIKFINYKELVKEFTPYDNPRTNKWYEHDTKNRKYVLTTDETVQSSKKYFKQLEDSQSLTYTDIDIENDSFKLKKSIQDSSNLNFIGCIASSLEFKIQNDFKYIKDQDLYVNLTTTVKTGNQLIAGPLGIFKVGEEGYIPEGWPINDVRFIREINEIEQYNGRFQILNSSEKLTADEYLQLCRESERHVGLHAIVTIPESENDVLWKIRVFTGFVDDIKRDKTKDLVRTITAYDYMHKLLNDYDVTDWYVWQYGEDDNDPKSYLTHPIYDLRNSFWNWIHNTNNIDPNDSSIVGKGEIFDQVSNASLINDAIQIPKTLNVEKVKNDNTIEVSYISEDVDGHPVPIFTKGSQNNIIKAGWPVDDMVCIKQVKSLGWVGASFRIDGEPQYVQVTPMTGDNPSQNGWYEQNAAGEYVPTVDPEVIPNKLYYAKNDKWDMNYLAYIDLCYETAGVGIRAFVNIPILDETNRSGVIRETQISAATVLQAICQTNGVFGQFNGNGKFEYIKLNITNPLEIEEQYQIEVKNSDISMPKITDVVIYDKTSALYNDDTVHTIYGDVKNGKKGSALAYYPSTDIYDPNNRITGKNAFPLTIDSNFLMNGLTQEQALLIAQKLYDNLSQLTMRNADLTIIAMPWLKCGQAISYYVVNEDTLFPANDLYPSDNLYPRGPEKVNSIIMSYEISGTGLFKGKIECKVEELTSDIENFNEIITYEMFQRKIGTDRLYSEFIQRANEITMQVINNEAKTQSKFEMTDKSITLEVQNRKDAISSVIKMTDKSIDEIAEKISRTAKDIYDTCENSYTLKTDFYNLEASVAEIKTTKVSNGTFSATTQWLGDRITSEVTRLDGGISDCNSKIDQTATNITLLVNNTAAGLRSEITVTNQGTVEFVTSNYVSFERIGQSGATFIEGANIRTGSISCDRIALGSVTISGATHEMQWRTAMLYDTPSMMVANKLGLTVKENSLSHYYFNSNVDIVPKTMYLHGGSTIYYLHVTKSTDVIKDKDNNILASITYVSDVSIDTTSTGATSSFECASDVTLDNVPQGYLSKLDYISSATVDVGISQTKTTGSYDIAVLTPDDLLKGAVSNDGYYAMGPEGAIGNNKGVWYQYNSTSGSAARRIILASENLT